jgi:SAM-dependent methyltransferase
MNENLTGKDAFDGSLLFEQGDFDARTAAPPSRKAILERLRRKPYFDADACAPRSDCLARRPCPLCGGEAKAPAFALHGFEHVTCRDCGFLHVDPILSPEAMRQHYEEENQWTGVMLNPVEQMVNRRMYRYTMERIAGTWPTRTHPGHRRGTGLFVQTACEDGYEASGVELNNRMLQRARELGIDMFSASLADLARGRRYGLVTIWFVLEHVPDPRGFLAEAAALLRDDGALFLAVPTSTHWPHGSWAGMRRSSAATAHQLLQHRTPSTAWPGPWACGGACRDLRHPTQQHPQPLPAPRGMGRGRSGGVPGRADARGHPREHDGQHALRPVCQGDGRMRRDARSGNAPFKGDEMTRDRREVWLMESTHDYQTLSMNRMPLAIGCIAAYAAQRVGDRIDFPCTSSSPSCGSGCSRGARPSGGRVLQLHVELQPEPGARAAHPQTVP